MNYFISFSLFTVLLFCSCGSNDSNTDSESLNSSTEIHQEDDFSSSNMNNSTSADGGDRQFNPNPEKIRSTGGLYFNGRVLFTKGWIDQNGDNLAIFTESGDEIYMFHYAFPNGSPILKRKVMDFVRNCEFDRTLEFVDGTIEITDLDNDNMGELSFMYKMACRSDVSPCDLKYLTLENGEKYIIRGSEFIDYGDGQTAGGEKNIDPSFKNGPTEFLNHANRVWDKFYIFKWS